VRKKAYSPQWAACPRGSGRRKRRRPGFRNQLRFCPCGQDGIRNHALPQRQPAPSCRQARACYRRKAQV